MTVFNNTSAYFALMSADVLLKNQVCIKCDVVSSLFIYYTMETVSHPRVQRVQLYHVIRFNVPTTYLGDPWSPWNSCQVWYKPDCLAVYHCHLIVSPLERESLNLLFSLHFSVTFPTVFHFIKNIPVYLYNQSKFYEFKTVVLIPPIIDSITSALVWVLASKVQALKVTTCNSISRLKISFK